MAAEQTPAIGSALAPQRRAEAALLGALMIDNRLADVIADKVQPFHFFEPLHARIYEAILREVALNRVANPVTLYPCFVDDPQMKEVGGSAISGS
jgi:replicative DNA helicase